MLLRFCGEEGTFFPVPCIVGQDDEMQNASGEKSMSLPGPADPEIDGVVKDVLSGDVDAFRILVERYQHKVFSVVRNLAAGRADTEDLAQMVFLKAFEHLDSYRPEKGRFLSWLYAIARNTCFNELRKKKGLSASEMNESAVQPGQERELSQKELFEALDQALEEMPVEYRSAFVLAEIHEMALSEVAEMEGVPVGTVKSRISRARTRLRKALKDREEVRWRASKESKKREGRR